MASLSSDLSAKDFSKIAIHHPVGIAIWEDILKGVFQFTRPGIPWVISANFDKDFEWFRAWQPDGVIAQCANTSDVDFFRALDVPVVNVSREADEISFPSIQIDDFSVGQMAADYFLDRGFVNFACYLVDNRDFMAARLAGLEDRLSGFQAELSVFHEKEYSGSLHMLPPKEEVQAWLLQLNEKTAIFAATDALGLELLAACRHVGRKVPEDISILGVSNNELLCNLEYPPLSSIRLPGKKLGFEAAKKLFSLLKYDSNEHGVMRLPPIDIVSRQSTDIYCVDDAPVSQALEFIKKNYHMPINVASVVRSVDVSRTALERRFRKLLGRTILEELVSERILKSKELLVTTNLSMQAIGKESGFTNARQFSDTFRKHTGVQPSKFREQFS